VDCLRRYTGVAQFGLKRVDHAFGSAQENGEGAGVAAGGCQCLRGGEATVDARVHKMYSKLFVGEGDRVEFIDEGAPPSAAE
jgi:hypothetical protein